MLPTACGACAETFIRKAELGRWSGKWNLGLFVLWFLPAAITSQLAQLTLSPHLLPPFCHQLENAWPTIILDAGSKQDILSNLRGGTPTSSYLQVGYCWCTFSVLLWVTLSWSICKVSAGHWDTQHQKSLSNGISHAANCHLWCRQLSRTLTRIFQSIFIFFTFFLQLKLNKGLKEISLVGNSFSFLERQSMFLPFSVHFSAFLFPAAWWRSCFEERCVSWPAAPSTPAFD